MAALIEPQIELAGLKIWIHGRQFPKHEDYWDANWIVVSVHCSAPGADIWIKHNPCVHLSELVSWHGATTEMQASLSGEAKLDCMEPHLSVRLTTQSLGKIEMNVKITPDNTTQKHLLKFEIDQSYLPAFLARCKSVLAEFPIRGQQPTASDAK